MPPRGHPRGVRRHLGAMCQLRGAKRGLQGSRASRAPGAAGSRRRTVPGGTRAGGPSCPPPPPPSSFQPQGEELELARSQCQRETQSSTGGGDRTKTFMYVKGKRGKKKKRYLNKTALSLFSALPLLLEGFLFPDGDTPRRGWSTHTDEHPGEIPAVGHRDGHCAPPPRTERHCPLPLRRGKRWSFAPSSCSVLEKLCRKCAHC